MSKIKLMIEIEEDDYNRIKDCPDVYYSLASRAYKAIKYGKSITECDDTIVLKNEESEWIPVNERLPEESTSVLVWCPERKSIYCAYFEAKQWWVWGVEECFQKFPLEIIAWMPSPTSYKS